MADEITDQIALADNFKKRIVMKSVFVVFVSTARNISFGISNISQTCTLS